jgi:RHS repeat-associated protein
LGDGVTSTLWSPTHTYTLYGTYPVSLTVQSNQEADRQAAQITVLNTLPPTTTVVSYVYDGLYRLTRAAHSTGETFEYAYDAVGNRTAYTRTLGAQVVTTYTYDAANRLTAVNGQAYTWDANGNLLNDGSKDYVYDQANRLTNINANGLSWSASYNGDGARLREVTNGAPTTYTLDPSASSEQALNAGLVQVLAQQDASGVTTYLYGVARIGEEQPTGWAYHLSDALGSVRQLVDDAAQVTLARGYMPYGEPLWSVGSGSSAYGYTGEDWNTTTQLVFLRARYMQPGLGMFLSHDPQEGDAEQPATMNGWNYAAGNPVNRVDPTGASDECSECEILGALENVSPIIADKNMGFYKDQSFFIAARSPDRMNCIFTQFIRGTMKKWIGQRSQPWYDLDTYSRWWLDYPGDPRRWNPGDFLWTIKVGEQYTSMTRKPIKVLERREGVGWDFHDTPGFPPKLVEGRYEADVDFELQIFDASNYNPWVPLPVHTIAWHFHETRSIK